MDPSNPAAQWASYFGDLLMATEIGVFESEHFGFFYTPSWPWVWSYAGNEFWYIVDSIPIENGMFAFSPGKSSWLYTNRALFPLHYRYGDDDWFSF